MDIKFSFVDILNLIALILGLLYAFQIVTLKKRTQAIKFFAFYLLNITFITFFFFLLKLKLDKVATYLTPLLIVSVLLLPVNLWIYQKKLIFNDEKRNINHYLVPAISGFVTLVLLLGGTFIPDKATKIFLLQLLQVIVVFLLTLGFLALNVVYLIFSFNLLRRHQRNIRNFYSYTQKVDLQWVKIMIFGYLFLLTGLVTSEFIKGDASNFIFYTVLIVYLVYIGHNALKQKDIWSEQKTSAANTGTTEDEAHFEQQEHENYTESQLHLFQELKEKLVLMMEEEKPYLDQDLSILKLAKDLNTNTKYLSHVINSEFRQNFINFINEYRIREVKSNLLDNNQTYTIEALGQNAGFKSKSSFNAAFKKSTGHTPSSFLKLNSESANV